MRCLEPNFLNICQTPNESIFHRILEDFNARVLECECLIQTPKGCGFLKWRREQGSETPDSRQRSTAQVSKDAFPSLPSRRNHLCCWWAGGEFWNISLQAIINTSPALSLSLERRARFFKTPETSRTVRKDTPRIVYAVGDTVLNSIMNQMASTPRTAHKRDKPSVFGKGGIAYLQRNVISSVI